MKDEDLPVLHQVRSQIAVWEERVAAAKQMGDDALLQKAMKHLKRYQKKRDAIERDLAQYEAEVKAANSSGQPPCQFCQFFQELDMMYRLNGVPAPSDEELADFAVETNALEEVMREDGSTLEELENAKAVTAKYDLSILGCDNCRDRVKSMMKAWQRMSESV